MSSLTDYLKLFKYNTATDGKETFSIDTSMNNNWDIIDSNFSEFKELFTQLVENPMVGQFIVGDKSTITIKENTKLSIDGVRYTWDADTSYTVSSILDTGSIAAGKDYCIYIVTGGNIVVSLNSTYPTGYSTSTSKKIGGFHTICRTVTSSNAPTLAANSFWSTHPAIGYTAGDIIPNSVWTCLHRPTCDPSGMVYIPGDYGERPFWVDIYLQSGTFSSTKSVYGGTIINSRQPILHAYDMTLVGKKLATDNQFLIFAEGSNQKTNITGSKIPSPASTGGHLDTASKAMISGFFVEECCGYLWQWLDEVSSSGQSGWSAYSDTARGGSYGMPYVLRAGGECADSTSCGSWSRASNATRSSVGAHTGARGVSSPISITDYLLYYHKAMAL